MTTTYDDNATSWRDLADALTPPQVAYHENWESLPDLPPMVDGSAAPPAEHERALLFTAREYVGRNAAAALYADVAPPPEDGRYYPWEHDGNGEWFRFFAGTTREVGKTAVTISGLQYVDGTIRRSVSVDGDSEGFDATRARLVAAALIEAAEELERL